MRKVAREELKGIAEKSRGKKKPKSKDLFDELFGDPEEPEEAEGDDE